MAMFIASVFETAVDYTFPSTSWLLDFHPQRFLYCFYDFQNVFRAVSASLHDISPVISQLITSSPLTINRTQDLSIATPYRTVDMYYAS